MSLTALSTQVTEDEDNEDDSKEVYFVPKEPESRECCLRACPPAPPPSTSGPLSAFSADCGTLSLGFV
jgi:hypothetical protein